MLTLNLIYFNLALGGVAALTAMILHIGSLVGDCPQAQLQSRVIAVSVATGFATIGAGGVILIGLALPLSQEIGSSALLGALGFAALCLGLGFTHAIGALRANIARPVAQGSDAVKPA